MKIRLWISLSAVALSGLASTGAVHGQQASMTFFVSSVGKGNGADLGGLAGADSHCQALAKAAGSTETNWRAYLSTTEPGGVAATADSLALFGQRRLLVDVVGFRVEILEVFRHDHAFGILPRTFPDAVTRVDAGVTAGLRRTQISTPIGER